MGRRTSVGIISALALLAATSPLASGSPRPTSVVKAIRPDLVALAPEAVFGPATEFMMPLGVDAPMVIDGCFVDERVRRGAQRCLRFDGIVGNAGSGPLELAYGLDTSRKDVVAHQRIFFSDGSYRDRFATRTEYHPTHVHFHVKSFYVATLWRSTKGGGLLGALPVATGDKNGFCPEDSAPLDERDERAGRHYSCFTEGERELGPNQVVGISAGWKDIYSYSLPDQYVEISGVRDGYYALRLELDPNNVFTEANEANNTVCVVLRLEATTAELLDPMPPC